VLFQSHNPSRELDMIYQISSALITMVTGLPQSFLCYFFTLFQHLNIIIFKKNSITREEAQTPMLLLFQETKYMLEKITDPIN